jgi:hypothetical protein
MWKTTSISVNWKCSNNTSLHKLSKTYTHFAVNWEQSCALVCTYSEVTMPFVNPTRTKKSAMQLFPLPALYVCGSLAQVTDIQKLLTQQHLYYLRVLWSTRKNSLCLDSSIPKKSSDSLRIWQNWVSSCTGNCDGIPPASCSVTIRDIHNIILCLCYKCSLGYNNSC